MRPEYKEVVEEIAKILASYPEDKRFEILADVKLALVADLQLQKNRLEARLEYIKGIIQLK